MVQGLKPQGPPSDIILPAKLHTLDLPQTAPPTREQECKYLEAYGEDFIQTTETVLPKEQTKMNLQRDPDQLDGGGARL